MDDNKNRMPDSLQIDFESVNKIVNRWRNKSLDFLYKALKA